MVMSGRLMLLHVLSLVDDILLWMLLLLLLLVVILMVCWLTVLIVMLRLDYTVPGRHGDGTLLMLQHCAIVCRGDTVLRLGAILHLRRVLLHLSDCVVISRTTKYDFTVNFLSYGGSFYHKFLNLNWCAR